MSLASLRHMKPELYEQATALGPTAARIALVLLMGQQDIPESLRRAVGAALTSRATAVKGDEPGASAARDARAARRLVECCRKYCRAEVSQGVQRMGVSSRLSLRTPLCAI